MSKFKKGDIVVDHQETQYTVASVPGDPEYDDMPFAAADEGMLLKHGVWVFQDEYELLEGDDNA